VVGPEDVRQHVVGHLAGLLGRLATRVLQRAGRRQTLRAVEIDDGGRGPEGNGGIFEHRLAVSIAAGGITPRDRRTVALWWLPPTEENRMR
jgi:hypothetical protein